MSEILDFRTRARRAGPGTDPLPPLEMYRQWRDGRRAIRTTALIGALTLAASLVVLLAVIFPQASTVILLSGILMVNTVCTAKVIAQ